MQGFRRFNTRLCAATAFLVLACVSAAACDIRTPCAVDGGEYFISLPKGWNGKDQLPSVFFFHGFSSSAEEVMANEALVRGLSEAGVALIALEGAQNSQGTRSWSFPGGSLMARDDFAFVARVRADVAAHWPIDPARALASGFSVGGSMVWYIACQTPTLFAAYAPVAGAFWSPEPESCAAPVSLRHVHGMNDHTVPMTGRVLRGGMLKQGDVMKSFATLKRLDGCQDLPAQSTQSGALSCQRWPAAACGSGRELVLCLHQGEHEIEAGWVLDGVRWLQSLQPTPSQSLGSAHR